MEIKISRTEIKDYLKLKTLSELTHFKENIRLFEEKYKMKFGEYKENLERREEDFEMWDDFIEWEAYEEFVVDLNKRLDEIDRASHITVTE